MRLWFARHGDAGLYVGDKDPKKERERPLTPLGVKQVTAVAKRMKKDGEEPRVILASVFVRTMQTADIFGRILGCPVDPQTMLVPHAPVADYIERLASDEDEGRRIMIVGHHDNIDPFLAKYDEEQDEPPLLVKAEVRRYACDRKDCSLVLKYRMTPEEAGAGSNLMGWREITK